jgi:hypothetical protein
LGLPAPDAEPLSADGASVPLAWRAFYVAATWEAPDPALAVALQDKGFELVVIGTNAAAWAESTPTLAKLLGRSA